MEVAQLSKINWKNQGYYIKKVPTQFVYKQSKRTVSINSCRFLDVFTWILFYYLP